MNSAKNVIKVRSLDGSILQIECHESLASTAALAKQYANSGYPDRYIVFSTEQTERGALGEKFSDTQSAKGLFMSCILRPSMFPSQAGLLRAMSSVAMITALEEHTEKKLGIGWVSDIFCESKKIGGVTLEGKLDNFTSYEYIIVTFALRLSKKNFPPRLDDMIKRVFEAENSSTELIIAKNILAKFFPLYFNMKHQTKFMDVYSEKLAMKGSSAKYISGGKRFPCKIVDVNTASGALVVELGKGRTAEVSAPTNIILPKTASYKKQKKHSTEE